MPDEWGTRSPFVKLPSTKAPINEISETAVRSDVAISARILAAEIGGVLVGGRKALARLLFG